MLLRLTDLVGHPCRVTTASFGRVIFAQKIDGRDWHRVAAGIDDHQIHHSIAPNVSDKSGERLTGTVIETDEAIVRIEPDDTTDRGDDAGHQLKYPNQTPKP